MACLVSGGCAQVGWGQGHAENKEAKAALSDGHASGKAVTGQRGVGGRSGWYPRNETGSRGGTHAGETSNFQEREQGRTPEQGYAPGNGAAHTRSPASPSTRAADPGRSGRPAGWTDQRQYRTGWHACPSVGDRNHLNFGALCHVGLL